MRAAVSCRRENGEFSRRGAEFVPLSRDPIDRVAVLVVVDEQDLPANAAAADDEPTPAELHELVRLFRQRAARLHGMDRLIGVSPAMNRIREQVRLARHQRGGVLIVGPPGSGREHVAKTIHYRESTEPCGPLTPVDCSLMDRELIQSTVTAFLRRRHELGEEQAGALLLLEIDRLGLDAQAELAGLLELPDLELNFLATARRPLLGPTAPQGFRTDLAYALSTLVIELPSLAERAEDIPLLAQMFVEDFNAANDRQLGGFSPEAMDQLTGLSWPDNIDELASCVEKACRRSSGPLVQPSDLPEHVRIARDAARYPPRDEQPIVLDEFLKQVERELIHRAMACARDNKAQAARLLGVTPARLRRRLEQLDR